MDKFYQDIQEQLENRPEPHFEESAWTGMREKLAVYQKPRPSRKRFIWAMLFLGIFLAGGLAAWQMTQGDESMLFAEKNEVNNGGSIAEIRNSTSDFSSPELSKTPNEGIEVEGKSFEPKPLVTTGTASIVTTQKAKPKAAPSALSKNENFIEAGSVQPSSETLSVYISDVVKPITSTNISQRKTLSLNTVSPLESALSGTGITLVPNVKEAASPIIFPGQRKNFQLGFIAGPQWILTPDIQTQLGAKGSLFARYNLSRSFQVWGEISGLRLWYKAPEEKKSLGIPEWIPTSPDQTLTETRVNRIGMDYSGGISYLHPIGQHGNFHIGMGIGGRLWEPYSVIYGFKTERPGEEDEYEEEEEEIFEDLESEFFLQFRTGYSLHITPKLTWIIQANYQPGIPDDDDPFPPMFGIESGLSLKLGIPRLVRKKK